MQGPRRDSRGESQRSRGAQDSTFYIQSPATPCYVPISQMGPRAIGQGHCMESQQVTVLSSGRSGWGTASPTPCPPPPPVPGLSPWPKLEFDP